MASEKVCTDLSLFNDSLRAFLICPLCGKFCKSPIFMCTNGHHVCNNCQPNITYCPTWPCQAAGRPTARSLPLENMADKLMMPCDNKYDGCEEELNAEDMVKHWEICADKYFQCNLFSTLEVPKHCSWEGSRRDMVAHVKETHPGCYSEDDVMQCDVDISCTEFGVGFMGLISAHGELFWIVFLLNASCPTAEIYSTYVGKKYNATKYRCKFVYSSKNGCIETTNICDIEYRYWDNRWGVDPTGSTLRVHKPTLEQYLSEGIFSFTAQILKI